MENSVLLPEEAGPRFPQDIVSLGGVQIIRSSGELFNHVDAGLPMWSSDGDRLVRVEIEFRTTFADVPMISLGLTGIDSAHDQNLRFWLREADVTEKGFSIEFSTWGDTHIARAAVSWSAIGEAYVKLSPPAARSLRGKTAGKR